MEARADAEHLTIAPPRLLRAAALSFVIGGAAVTILVSVLGTIDAISAPVTSLGVRPGDRFPAFALDVETNAASAWSSLLSLAASVATLAVAVERRGTRPWPFWFLGAFLGFMAADDWFSLHEHF